ncbi:MAG: hypothetical protein AMXMBFR84_24850 [Candidatus Hydrogenedentota bacterium]
MPVRLLWIPCVLGLLAFSAYGDIRVQMDATSRFVNITYDVPASAPDLVQVFCSWAPAATVEWRPAKVMPYISESAYNLIPANDWLQWRDGRIVERRSAGLQRTVVFNPYPEAQMDGRLDVDFRIEIRDEDGALLSEVVTRIAADNSDVYYIEDWSNVLQADALTGEAPHWTWDTTLPIESGASLGNALTGNAGPDTAIRQLTYPLDLKGWYAIYVSTVPEKGSVRIRLTGDERSDTLGSRHRGEEVLWRWAKMDRQHLVLSQPHHYTGYTPAHVDYVKLVPVTEAQVKDWDAQFGSPDKVVAGYFEPYSWAFVENIQQTLQHREPLTAFHEARFNIVDIQIGRFGMKSVFETRQSDQLLYSTIGDPIGDVVQPTTDNVGRMQQYTNTLDAELRYAHELQLTAHANFGATNCYPGSPLQGDFSKQHPDWMRGSALRYEIPEVRAYVLALYREALDIGAPAISIDFCRYPEGIDTKETCTAFLRELRALASEFAAARGEPVPILIRFPGTGVRKAELFDYVTWAREGLVDYLCPSNIQGRHCHIDMTPYMTAVRGTTCTLLPALDGLWWALPFPGPFLWRVKQLYDSEVTGVYLYQADARVLGTPGDRRTMRLLASRAAVDRFWNEDAAQRPNRSKGIYITPPSELGVHHPWERIRIWVEGVPMGPLEAYIDGNQVTSVDGPPYLVGTEEYTSDGVIPSGEHELRIRVRDGEGWLEQAFAVKGE